MEYIHTDIDDPKKLRRQHLSVIQVLLRLMQTSEKFTLQLSPQHCKVSLLQLGPLIDSTDQDEFFFGNQLLDHLILHTKGLDIFECVGRIEEKT